MASIKTKNRRPKDMGLLLYFLTTCCKKLKVLGVGVRTFSNNKFQITNHKYQTNHNDRNSKSQTIGV
jgi:hypothetical protein